MGRKDKEGRKGEDTGSVNKTRKEKWSEEGDTGENEMLPICPCRTLKLGYSFLGYGRMES